MYDNKNLLAPLQKALEKQLNQEYERVHLELLEKKNALRQVDKEKEDVGVELYSLQQKLADFQIEFENSHDNYNKVFQEREESEAKLSQLNLTSSEKNKIISDLKSKIQASSDELTKLNISIKQIENYDEEMKSDINVTKNVTYKAEENILKKEKEKKIQDYLIANLKEEIGKLTQNKSYMEAQLESQKAQTAEARQILELSEIEMDKIKASKKNLFEQWKECLSQIEVKNKSLILCKDTLRSLQEKNIKIMSEITGIDNEIKKANKVAALSAEFYNNI